MDVEGNALTSSVSLHAVAPKVPLTSIVVFSLPIMWESITSLEREKKIQKGRIML